MIYGFLASIIFCGYIIYDTDNLIKRYTYDEYIWASVALYLDIVNLFLQLLALFRAAESWRDWTVIDSRAWFPHAAVVQSPWLSFLPCALSLTSPLLFSWLFILSTVLVFFFFFNPNNSNAESHQVCCCCCACCFWFSDVIMKVVSTILDIVC